MTINLDDPSDVIFVDTDALITTTITPNPATWAVAKSLPHRHDFRLVLELDKLYFKCECCKVRLTIFEVERMLNK